MAKPYALSLYSKPEAGPQRYERSLTARAMGWRRSIRSIGGPWQGSFQLDGSDQELQDAFERWMGYEVRERAGGQFSWSGLVYEMDLTKNGVTRRRSFDLMASRVKTTYTTMVYTGENYLQNAGFEDYSNAVPNDLFYGWKVDNDAGTGTGSVQAAAGAHGGAVCVELTGDQTGGFLLTYIRQNIQVTPGARYQLQFWTKGDAGTDGERNTGLYGVYDPNTTNWIFGPIYTYYVGAAWLDRSAYFIGPADGEVQIFFYAPWNLNRIAYFDDVTVLEEAQCVLETEWASVWDSYTPPIMPDAELMSAEVYGLKEEIVHLDNYPQATSIAYRDSYLAENGWPWPRPIAAGGIEETRLDVYVAGFAHTMNWLYVTQGDGAEHDLDHWLNLLVGTDFGLDVNHGGTFTAAGDCQFVKTGYVKSNTLQVPEITTSEERPWDVIKEIASLGDANGNPWRAWVTPERLFVYRDIVTTPRYYIRRGGVYDTMSGAIPSNPWLLKPAVYRDMTYRPGNTEPGSFLQSTQDIYVEEVEMADGWDQASLKTVLFSEAEMLEARAERGSR